MMKLKNVSLLSLLSGLLFFYSGLPVYSETELQIDNDTSSFTNYSLESGKVKVSVNYKPFGIEDWATVEDDQSPKNLTYTLFYNGQQKLTTGVFTTLTGSVELKDIDADGTDELVVTTFSGGAHCCTSHYIYSWMGRKFLEIPLENLDGRGAEFRDLDRDGTLEVVSQDQSFFYEFGAYAFSFPPSRIYELQGGELVENTRNYPQALKGVAWQMFQAIQETEKNGDGDIAINGLLAGYVGQKALLGEFEEGWEFMLQHYSPKDTWGVEAGQDFPTALEAFLVEQGYISQDN